VQESHGPQSRMRYHTPDALALAAVRLNHEMLVVSMIHRSCPLRLIQVEVGRLLPTVLPSTQSSKWNTVSRDCADGFMLQGSCFTGPIGLMTQPSLDAQGSRRDENLATRLLDPTSLSWLLVCICHLCQHQRGSVTNPSIPLQHSRTGVVQITIYAEVDTIHHLHGHNSTWRAQIKLIHCRSVARQIPIKRFGEIVDFNDHTIDALPSYPLHPKPTLKSAM
jgi:hypothetical protein